MAFLSSFIFAAESVIPLFFLILAGILLKKFNWIDDKFIKTGSKIVFYLSLPALLILRIGSLDASILLTWNEIFLTVGISIGLTLLTWFIGGPFLSLNQKGPFVQGSYRGNMAIIGMAIAFSVLGDIGVQKVAMFVAILMPLYNILAAIVLTIPAAKMGDQEVNAGHLALSTLKKIITNPLIISVSIGFLIFFLNIELPGVITKPLTYLTNLVLPLALICIGGGIDFSHLKSSLLATSIATIIRVVIAPIIAFVLCRILQVDSISTVVIIIVMGAPTAISSYPMTRVIGGDHELSANIVALTTLMAIPTQGIALMLLKMNGYL